MKGKRKPDDPYDNGDYQYPEPRRDISTGALLIVGMVILYGGGLVALLIWMALGEP